MFYKSHIQFFDQEKHYIYNSSQSATTFYWQNIFYLITTTTPIFYFCFIKNTVKPHAHSDDPFIYSELVTTSPYI